MYDEDGTFKAAICNTSNIKPLEAVGIKACVRSNRKKAVFKCPRSSSAHFYCTISFMDICHGEHLLFFF